MAQIASPGLTNDPEFISALASACVIDRLLNNTIRLRRVLWIGSQAVVPVVPTFDESKLVGVSCLSVVPVFAYGDFIWDKETQYWEFKSCEESQFLESQSPINRDAELLALSRISKAGYGLLLERHYSILRVGEASLRQKGFDAEHAAVMAERAFTSAVDAISYQEGIYFAGALLSIFKTRLLNEIRRENSGGRMKVSFEPLIEDADSLLQKNEPQEWQSVSGDNLAQAFADLILQGYSKKECQEKLQLSKGEYAKIIEVLKNELL